MELSFEFENSHFSIENHSTFQVTALGPPLLAWCHLQKALAVSLRGMAQVHTFTFMLRSPRTPGRLPCLVHLVHLCVLPKSGFPSVAEKPKSNPSAETEGCGPIPEAAGHGGGSNSEAAWREVWVPPGLAPHHLLCEAHSTA